MVGHSMMTVDSVHASIERAAKYKTVYSPSEWLTVVTNSRYEPGPYTVYKLDYYDFEDWKGFSDFKHFKNEDGSEFRISQVRTAVFEKGSVVDGFLDI